jgi:hypothetical protein
MVFTSGRADGSALGVRVGGDAGTKLRELRLGRKLGTDRRAIRSTLVFGGHKVASRFTTGPSGAPALDVKKRLGLAGLV